MCEAKIKEGAQKIVCSSGGNAGLAVAYACKQLNCRATVVLPETSNPRVRERLARDGAEVIVQGAVWDEADKLARQLAMEPGAAYVPPFDDPFLWTGHSTLIHELVAEGKKPAGIICTVGGGGLLNGLCEGLEAVGWHDVVVYAVETIGAASLFNSIQKGQIVPTPITSIAKSLGASRVSQASLDWVKRRDIRPVLVSDRQAVAACLRFLDDHGFVVEPACGAAMAAIAEKKITEKAGPLVVIVCGGTTCTLEDLQAWDRSLPLD